MSRRARHDIREEFRHDKGKKFDRIKRRNSTGRRRSKKILEEQKKYRGDKLAVVQWSQNVIETESQKGSATKMFEVTIIKSFSAAHLLAAIGGKCEELHGHNFKVEITVGAEQLNSSGLLIDFRDLKNILMKFWKQWIIIT